MSNNQLTNMTNFREVSPDFSLFNEDMSKNIGRKVKYLGSSMGSIGKTGIFKIVGIQKNWCDEACYRVECISENFKDTFGSCMSPSEIQFC
jgi:hypothetical protein